MICLFAGNDTKVLVGEFIFFKIRTVSRTESANKFYASPQARGHQKQEKAKRTSGLGDFGHISTSFLWNG